MGRRSQHGKPPHSSKETCSQLRVIGGQWRGRKLDFITADSLRPTPDRVRETLFNWIQAYLPEARCLDLFSGTGALGIEALSRGVNEVTFVELNRTSAQQLTKNLQTLNASPSANVITIDALQWLAAGTHAKDKPFDIIFMDPPFRKDMAEQCCQWLETHNMLSEHAVIYIETEAELAHLTVPDTWHEHRKKTAGQVCYRLFVKAAE